MDFYMPGYFPTDSQWHKDMLMTQRVPPLHFEFLFLTLKKHSRASLLSSDDETSITCFLLFLD